MIHWESWLLWGFLATLLLTTTSAVTQGMGLTRMNIPYLLGTMFTPDRDRARVYGFLAHLTVGWVFSLAYVLIFRALDEADWWHGAIIGLLHALFVLVVVTVLLPGVHPRMASEQHGPAAQRLLEPPGFLALNYGIQTPLSIFISHAVFGAVLGAFYQLH